MRALRGRQAALLALQQDAESKLAATRQKSNEGNVIITDLHSLQNIGDSTQVPACA